MVSLPVFVGIYLTAEHTHADVIINSSTYSFRAASPFVARPVSVLGYSGWGVKASLTLRFITWQTLVVQYASSFPNVYILVSIYLTNFSLNFQFPLRKKKRVSFKFPTRKIPSQEPVRNLNKNWAIICTLTGNLNAH